MYVTPFVKKMRVLEECKVFVSVVVGVWCEGV